VTGRPDPERPTLDEAHPPAGWVRLARLGRPFQLRGALRAQTLGPAADRLLLELGGAGETVWLSGVGATRLRDARRIGGGVAVSFQGIYTPERARDHVHRDLWGPADHAAGTHDPADPLAAAADADAPGDAPAVELLEGAPVRLDGRPYGRVSRVVLGAQDLLEVDGPTGPRWVPWQAPYVRWDGEAVAIDDPPPGLLDDD
jgi:ribosomal 30S subunit maturation factor RimM